MDNQTAQAFDDFDSFLRGERAPALVGHALATVVRQDIRVVADAVLRLAYANGAQDRISGLLAARNKVFDIFFYRVVRFRRVFEFFPRFERAIVEAAPKGDQAAIQELFRRFPWQEIRPLGSLNDPAELALEVRGEATVTPERFNEELYRNATHQILSADRRFSFADDRQQAQIGEYQAEVAEVFDDFVSLIKDAILRREIMLSNVADRDIVYKDRPQFQAENYLGQLADLAIALFNDAFLEHSVQIFNIIRTLATGSGLDVERIERVQKKGELINKHKLSEYCSIRTGPILLRSVLPIFPQWRPDRLLDQLRNEEDRRERELALAILTAYGRDIYTLIVDTLERSEPSSPWHFQRNLAYLLGHLATDQTVLRNRAVQALALHLRRESAPQLSTEIISALAAIRNEQAVDALAAKLRQFEGDFGKSPDVTELCHQIVDSLVAVHTDASLQAAVDFCVRHGAFGRHADAFSRVTLPPSVREALEARVRREVRKMRMSFSLLGDPSAARGQLLSLGNGTLPDVAALADEVAAAFPPGHELGAAAAEVRARPAPPPPPAYDLAFHRLLEDRNLPEALSYAFEAGIGGRLELHTRGGISCEASLRKGELWHASVPSLFSNDEDSFFWIFALEPQTISALAFDPEAGDAQPRTLAMPTPELIREGLFRAKHVQQIIGGILSPESRFRRRQSAPPESYFETIESPTPYRSVWEALGVAGDVKSIAIATDLSEHEIYRVLFDLLRENLVAIESGSVDRQLATVDDALTALNLFVRRIETHPTYFQSYQSASEVCSYLANSANDEAIRSAAYALHTYFLNAFNLRRVLTPEGVGFCSRALGLVASYLRSGAEVDRQELLEYLDIYLPEDSRWPAPPQDEASFIQSILEQIENIDGVNDPFDMIAALAGPPKAEEAAESLDQALSGGFDSGDTAIDTRSPVELLADASRDVVKPLRTFAREVERHLRLQREMPVEWLAQVEPATEFLLDAAARAGADAVREAASRLDRAFKQQRQHGVDVLTPAFCNFALAEYHKLEELMPSAFALAAPPEEVASRKETLFLKFLLRQVPDVDDRTVSKVLFAGYTSFRDIAETPPDEMSRAVGIPLPLGDKIFMKIYQYEEIYYRPKTAGAAAKTLAYFAISLNVLKEINAELERTQPGDMDDRKRRLITDRQRALWGVFALLCIRGDLDLVERLQKMVYEQRISVLDEYFAKLSSESFPISQTNTKHS